MGKPWSDERHLKLAEKRMEEVKSGKAKTVFFGGPIAEMQHKGLWYQFGVSHDGIFFNISKGKMGKDILYKELKGKAFEEFEQRITEWLRFPREWTVYKKKGKTG